MAYENGDTWTNTWSLSEAMVLLVLTAIEDSLTDRNSAWDKAGRQATFPDALDAIDEIRKMAVQRSAAGTDSDGRPVSRRVEPETIEVNVAILREVPRADVEYKQGWDGYGPEHHLIFDGQTYGRGENTPTIVDGSAQFTRLPCDGTNAATVLKAISEGILVDGLFWEVSDEFGEL